MTYQHLVWFTDPHAASSNPLSRRDDYQAAILDKLRQVKAVADKFDCPLVCGGDVFHHKAPSKTSHLLVNELMKLWRDRPPIGVVGNHDLSWDSLDHLDRQPLGVLIKAGAYRPLDFPDTVQRGPFSLRGIAYRTKIDPQWLRWPQATDDGRTLKVLILHAAASPTGLDFPGSETCYAYPALAEHSDADVILLGHWHRDQGIQSIPSPEKLTGKTHFVNVGALCRTTIADAGRKPQAVLIRFDPAARDLKLVPVVLSHAPGHEVLVVRERAEEKTQQAATAQFLDRLQQGVLFSFDVEQMIRDSGAEPAVVAEALRLYHEVT